MSDRRNVTYLYDGSFEGLLCTVFEIFSLHLFPSAIESTQFGQQSLDCDYVYVENNPEKANRVVRKIAEAAGKTELKRIYRCFLSENNGREMDIFNYIRACLKFGPTVYKRLTIDCINTVVSTARTVGGEAHLYTGFVRFSELENGVCYGAVEPKHDILPLLAPHFIRRYVNMPFIIHDIIRNRCLVYNGSEYGIFETENMPRLTLSDTEKNYRNLWKSFYDTIAIAERKNEKCRMTHLPKHYRRCMTEFF